MKKVVFGLLAMVFLVAIASCNKDQRAVKRLNGEWNLVTVNGFNVPEGESQSLIFNECKLKDDEYCNVTFKTSDESETTLYRVTDKGETLIYKDENDKEVKATIVTLDKEKLVIERTDPTLGTLKLEYSKK